MKKRVVVIFTLCGGLFFTACIETETKPVLAYDNGVVVLNAGNFSDNNGTLSLIQRNDKTTILDIFQRENSKSLAGSLSDYLEVDGKGIILVDNSSPGKDGIEIVNSGTFKSFASVPASDIENPRKIAKASTNTAYITAWDATGDFSDFYNKAGYVAVLDLVTGRISKKISVQNGAESIFVVGNEAFVGNTGSGKTVISVINTNDNTLKQAIEVGENPELIGLDINGKLWMYAGNDLLKFNTITKTIESRIPFKPNPDFKSPSSFVFSNDKKSIYYSYSYYDAADGYKQKGETYAYAIDATEIKTDKPFINRLFGGGLGVDPQSGNLYAGLIPSYKQAGYVFRYSATGMLIDSLKAEIAPSKFYFKN